MVDNQGYNTPNQLQHIFNNLFQQLNQAKTDEQRAEIQTQIIKQMVESTQITSAYICRWFPDKGQSLVTIEYVSEYANHLERESDLGEYITEDLSSILGQALSDGNATLSAANVFNLPLNDPDRQKFLAYGACSICFARIWSDNVLWGYIEMWESRYDRDFTVKEHALFDDIASKLGQSFAK